MLGVMGGIAGGWSVTVGGGILQDDMGPGLGLVPPGGVNGGKGVILSIFGENIGF